MKKNAWNAILRAPLKELDIKMIRLVIANAPKLGHNEGIMAMNISKGLIVAEDFTIVFEGDDPTNKPASSYVVARNNKPIAIVCPIMHGNRTFFKNERRSTRASERARLALSLLRKKECSFSSRLIF